MDLSPTTVIEYEGPDGDIFTLSGPRAGDQGVYLAKGEVTGLLDPPVRVIDEQVGSFAGSRYVGTQVERRELVFGVEILNEQGSKSWLKRESLWRKSWSFDRPGKLSVTTKDSGTRYLHVQLLEPPETEMDTDPNMRSVNRSVMTVVAYDPWWYEEPVEIPLTTQLGTTTSGSEELTFSVSPEDMVSGGLNPTDRPIDIVWALEAPGKYTVPDYDLEGGPLATRRIALPSLTNEDGDLRITTSRRVEQTSTRNNTPYWARMNGVRFLHKIPAYTEAHDFVVTVEGAPAGHRVSLILERPWSRAWGLE